jgi:hypothetical protein
MSDSGYKFTANTVFTPSFWPLKYFGDMSKISNLLIAPVSNDELGVYGWYFIDGSDHQLLTKYKTGK